MVCLQGNCFAYQAVDNHHAVSVSQLASYVYCHDALRNKSCAATNLGLTWCPHMSWGVVWKEKKGGLRGGGGGLWGSD